ncbi:MAG: IS110 family transposase [Leptolyngbyaceae cyanobacterium SM2_5_2]|nr:IS110 family transposase [Leptolyngbyaceae cyanobacterium SM2_5_2]
MPIIVGIEVAKASILCCLIDITNIPTNASEFARTYTPIPLLSDSAGMQKLLELGDSYVIEPTGDYSKIWIDALKANQKTVLRVNSKRVKALKEYHGIASKSDRYDAAFLALYGAVNLNNSQAFLSDYAEDLRTVVLHHQFLSRMTGNHQRRLWQLLSHEWPEVCRSKTGTKPQQNRRWLEADPPALWRYIAGEPIRNWRLRDRQLGQSIGSGLSDLSRALAAQVCELERKQYPYEERISALLAASEFKPYMEVLERFGMAELTRAAVLSRIYPFSQFLSEDGSEVVVRVPSVKTEGRYHRRNKSLGAFRLALGNATKLYQSGQVREERAAGSKLARCSLFLHVKSKIVILGDRPNLATPRLKQHIDYYQSLDQVPHNLAVMKTVSRIVKDLYREFLESL